MTQRQYRRRFNKRRGYELILRTIYRRVWDKIAGKIDDAWKAPPEWVDSSVPFQWEPRGRVMRISHEEMFKQPTYLYPVLLLAHSKIDPS